MKNYHVACYKMRIYIISTAKKAVWNWTLFLQTNGKQVLEVDILGIAQPSGKNFS